MYNIDDLNFECRHPGCGELFYRKDPEREKILTAFPYNRRRCTVCGRVTVPINGGDAYVCLHCSVKYNGGDLAKPTITMMPRAKRQSLPTPVMAFLILMVVDLILAGAAFFGGWQL